MLRRGVTAVLAVILALAAMAAAAQSFRSFVVKDIRVEGLQRTEPGTIFSYLPVKVAWAHHAGRPELSHSVPVGPEWLGVTALCAWLLQNAERVPQP
jgi:hypothetical protein